VITPDCYSYCTYPTLLYGTCPRPVTTSPQALPGARPVAWASDPE